jgi:hypothetical protein
LEIIGFCCVLLKPFGPVHAYVSTPAVDDVAKRLMLLPAQTGEPEDTEVITGVGLMTTTTFPGSDVQPFMVAVTLYVPDAAMAAFATVGFCCVLLNPFGPDQVYVAVPVVVVDAFSVSVAPLQIGALEEAAGIAGNAGSVRTTGPNKFDGQPFNVTNIEVYVPCERLAMVIFPTALEVYDPLTGAPLFFTYDKV